MSTGLYSGASGLALGFGLYRATSGLWGGASGLIAGFGGASLYLDFLTMTAPTFDSRVTFSRGSNATLTDSTGKITYAPANLLTYSEQFDNAAWQQNNASVNPDAVTSPNGTLTADKLIAAATTTSHYLRNNTTTTAGAAFSVYAKAAEETVFALGNAAGSAAAVFDLSNGTVTSVSPQRSATITAIGNGWYRCTFISLAGADTAWWYISLRGNFTSYTGNGTSGLYLWGAQLEPVTYQTTPSTYQATTSTAYYGPRFDYDPVTLAAKGLLIEEARTNIALYSAQFDNASWAKLNASVTANAVSAPDGTVSADLVVPDTSNNQHGVYYGATATAGTTYTHTVYAKAAGYNWLYMTEGNNVTAQASFNLAAGVLGTVTGTGSPSATITAVGNGWYRCSLTLTPVANLQNIQFRPNSANGGGSFAGDGTSGVYIWGAQLEAGAFATSYIPTVASTVTRSADVATMTGANFSSWYNQSQGTFVADTSTFKPTSSTAVSEVTSANDGTTNNRITTRFASNTADGVVVTSSSTVAAISTAYIAGVPTKLALATAANNFAFSVNGALIGTDTSGGMPTVNKLDIGNLTGFNFLNGHIRTLAYYNTRLPNSQLQTLTAPSLAQTLSLDFINNVYNVGF